MIRKYGCPCALAVVLAIGSAGPAAAQQETAPPAEEPAVADEGFDWGWLGLIGLAGLAGSRRRPEPARTTTTTGPVR